MEGSEYMYSNLPRAWRSLKFGCFLVKRGCHIDKSTDISVRDGEGRESEGEGKRGVDRRGPPSSRGKSNLCGIGQGSELEGR